MAQSDVIDEIVSTIADFENAPPDVLPPLADKIDPEAFQQLVSAESELTEPLTFEYLWYDVTVQSNREIIVTP